MSVFSSSLKWVYYNKKKAGKNLWTACRVWRQEVYPNVPFGHNDVYIQRLHYIYLHPIISQAIINI